MSEINSRELLAKLRSDQASFAANAYDKVVANNKAKLQDLDNASARKVDALRNLNKTLDARDSVWGTLSSFGTGSDTAREFTEGTISGTGSTVGGIGQFIDETSEILIDNIPGARSLNDYLQKHLPTPSIGDIAQKGEESLYELADSVDEQQLPSFQYAVNQTTPTGDLFDPSTWDIGDYSGEGAAGLLANMAGQFTPQLLAMVLTRGQSNAAQMGATAAVGGAQAGGGASHQAEQYIDQLNETELAEASGLYRDLRAQNLNHEEAKNTVKDVASSAAFAGAAPIGALGGAATAYVLGPLKSKLSGNLAARTAERTVISGLEEGAQEVGENVAAKALTNYEIQGNQDVTADSFTDFTLGAGFGASLGVPATAFEGTSKIAEVAKQQTKKAKESLSPIEQEAVDTGDLSKLKDEDGSYKNYPKTISVLSRIIAKDDPEQSPIAVAELRKVTTVLSGQVQFLKEDIQAIKDTAETDPEAKKKIAQIERELKPIESALTLAQELNANIVEETIKDVDVSQIISDIKEGKTEKSDQLITLMMADPERVSATDIDSLLESETELKPDQREFLRKYSEAQQAQHAVKDDADVNKDIFEGGKGYKGLFEYQRTFDNSIKSGNIKQAEKSLEELERFAVSRQEKLDAVKEAYATAVETQKPVQIQFDHRRGWVVADEKLSDQQIQANGGLTLHRNSSRLVDTIEKEAKALSTTYARMRNTLGQYKGAPETESSVTQTTAQPTVTPEFNPAPQPQETESSNISQAFDPEQSEVVSQVDRSTKQSELDKSTAQRNRLKAYFTQVKGKESDKTARPLVTKRDFLSGLDSEPDSINGFVSEQLTEKQHSHVTLFKEKAQEWSGTYDRFKAKKEGFTFQDPIQFLLEDGQLPENVKTALSFAAFNFIAENGFGAAYNDKEAVNTILKRSNDHPISAQERILFTAGTNEKLVIQSLGKAASQALGIKPDPDAPLNEIARMQGSLGNHALALLLRTGLVERVSVSGKIFKNENTKKENATRPFIRITRSWDGTRAGPVHEVTNQIATSAKNTGGVLSKLFKAEAGKKEPSFEKVTKVPTKAKGTRQEVSSKQKEILKKQGENAHYLRADMVQAFTAFDKDILDQIAGITPVNETTHKARHLGQSAKNEALSRELDYMRDFISGLKDKGTNLDQPFFFGREVWKVFRVGLASNTVNPQTSKIHRHMISMGGWETEVEFDSQTYDSFLLGVGESLGVSTDKQRNHQSLEETKELIEKDSIKSAVHALQSLLSGNSISRTEQESILAAIKEGGENFHSLEGLTALAQMETARTEGKSSFKTTLGREVDGVTNGPMLTLLQLAGAPNTDLLKNTLRKGGFYFEGDEQQEFTEWKSVPGNEDLYQSLAFDVHQAMQNAYINFKDLRHSIRATRYLLGKFVEDGAVTKAGRTSVKTPLTGFAFGSSVDTAVDAMGADLVDAYYTKVEEAKDSTELVQAIRAINIMIAGKAPNVPENLTKRQALNLELTSKQENAVVRTFSETTGSLVAQTMENRFADLIKTRDVLNQAAITSFELYNSAYEALRAKTVKDLTRTGELETDSKGRPLQDLNKEQEDNVRKQLKALEPVVHTPMSKISGQLSAGLNMSKVVNEITQDKKYNAESRFTDVGSLNSKGMVSKETNPGVATVIGGIHSTDSTISSLAYDENVALNVHDAHVLSVSGTQKGAQSLNKYTFETMAQYSLPIEIMESLGRSYQAYVKFANANPELRDTLKADYTKQVDRVNGFLKRNKLRQDKTDALTNLLAVTKTTATQTRKQQLEVMKDLVSVDQYALEGGSHKVTEKERTMIESLHEKAVKAFPVPTVPTEPTSVDIPTKGETVKRHVDSIETVPVPTLEQLQGILDISETADQLIRNSIQYIPQHLRPVAKGLLKHPYTKEVKVMDSKKLDKPLPESAYGAFIRDKGDNFSTGRIGYNFAKLFDQNSDRDPSYAPSLILHEIVHAVTTQSLGRRNQKIIKDLKPYHTRNVSEQGAELYRHVDKWITKNKESLNDRERYIVRRLVNVDELVAYGVTDKETQAVLSKIPSITKEKSFFDDIVSYVLKLIGLKKNHHTALRDVMILGARSAATTERDFNKSQQASALFDQDPEPESGIERLTTEQVFDGLADTSRPLPSQFASHLKETLNQIVEKIHGPFGAYTLKAKQEATYTVEETYLKALAKNELPFASRALAYLKLSHQEAFVLEQVELTMKEVLSNSDTTYRELAKLFREARASLKNDPNFDQSAFDFIFKPEPGIESKSDYLARFAAISVAYQPLYNHLQGLTTEVRSKRLSEMKLGEAIQELFNRGLTILNSRITHTYEGQRADAKLEALLQRLVDMEAKKKATITYHKNSTQQKLEDAIHEISEKGRSAVEKVGKSKLFKNNPSNIVKAIGSITSTVAGDRADKLLDVIEEVRNRNHGERQGMIAGMLTEARGAKGDNILFHELLRESNRHEQERKHLIDETASLVRNSFLNDGKDLTRKEREALTRTFIRTDLASLLDDFSLSEIADLVLDPAKLEAQITSYENELSGSNRDYYLKSTKDLGLYLATGMTVGDNQMLNAHNIAYLANTPRFIQGKNKLAEANLPIIDKLASLYAVRWLPEEIKKNATQTLKSETRRGKESGIELILKLHKGLQKDAMDTLFGGNPVHFIKGYTKEIYDPHVNLMIASAEEGKRLKQQGYSEGNLLPKDPADPSDQKRLYISRDGGLRSHLTGIFSYTGKRTRGSKVHSGLTNVLSDKAKHFNNKENARIATETENRINRMFKPQPNYDPSKRNGSRLVPVLDHHGNAVNYRYMMTDETKDKLLDRNNEIDTVMGAMAGSTFDKATTETQNKVAVEALYEQYKAEFKLKPEAYIRVSAESTDEEIRQTYNLLPDATKHEIKRVWGKNEMWVRTDLYDLNFGYRKYSLSEIFDKTPQERSIMESLFSGLLTMCYDEEAAQKVLRAEDVWQELVRITKDILVIKNLFTLLGNISSNVTLLLWQGVPATKIISTHTTAIKGLLNYQRDRKELAKLERLLDIGYVQATQQDDYKLRIVELKDSLERNPIKKMVDAGLFQTIVEDVDNDDDRFSYTSRLSRWSEQYTQYVPDSVKTVGKTLLMTHDTPLYKLLNQATSMSDFVARYSLYEHVTTREKSPMGDREAIQLAVDSFVNYDIPSHKKLQYLNDMGIVWFTKYYMRIQKVLFHLYRDNPGRSIALVTLENLFPWIPTLVDAGFWNKIGNPFSVGAFKLPGVVDEIIALKATLSPFN